MWPCPNIDLSLQRNAVLPIGFQLIADIENTPISLLPFTITCGIRYSAGSGLLLASPVVEIVEASLGLFDIIFDGRPLSGLPEEQGVAALAYEVLATDSDGPMPILRGTIYLIPGVL